MRYVNFALRSKSFSSRQRWPSSRVRIDVSRCYSVCRAVGALVPCSTNSYALGSAPTPLHSDASMVSRHQRSCNIVSDVWSHCFLQSMARRSEKKQSTSGYHSCTSSPPEMTPSDTNRLVYLWKWRTCSLCAMPLSNAASLSAWPKLKTVRH
jgi:hypothetical protein